MGFFKGFATSLVLLYGIHALAADVDCPPDVAPPKLALDIAKLGRAIGEGIKKRVQQISTVFENSTTQPQYSFLADIGDGAGVTGGRVGFTSRTGDLVEVVKRYVKKKSSITPLRKYVGCLEKIKGTPTYPCLFPSVSKEQMESYQFKSKDLLKFDFGKAWSDAGRDPVMREVQDEMVNEELVEPAQKHFRNFGLKTPFGLAVVYDTHLQQRSQVQRLAKIASAAFAKTHEGRTSPSNPEEEQAWLKIYLTNRLKTLKKSWGQRVVSLLEICESGNMDLEGNVLFHYNGTQFVLPDQQK